jgi:hypothetical protein
MLHEGDGVPMDRSEAQKWITAALRQNDEHVLQALAKCADMAEIVAPNK